jgi:hypothetical protein
LHGPVAAKSINGIVGGMPHRGCRIVNDLKPGGEHGHTPGFVFGCWERFIEWRLFPK